MTRPSVLSTCFSNILLCDGNFAQVKHWLCSVSALNNKKSIAWLSESACEAIWKLDRQGCGTGNRFTFFWDYELLIKNGPSWHLSMQCNKHICPCQELCFDAKDSSVLLSQTIVNGDLKAAWVDMLLWGALEEDSGDGFSGLGGFVAVGTQACGARRKTHTHRRSHERASLKHTSTPFSWHEDLKVTLDSKLSFCNMSASFTIILSKSECRRLRTLRKKWAFKDSFHFNVRVTGRVYTFLKCPTNTLPQLSSLEKRPYRSTLKAAYYNRHW